MQHHIQEIWPEGMPRPGIPYSPAIRAGDWLFVSGQSASDLVTGLAAEAVVPAAFPYYQDAVAKQAAVLYGRVGAIVEAAGAKPEQVVRVNQWYVAGMASPDYRTGDLTVNNKRYVQEKNRYFTKLSPPSTGIGVRGTLVEGALVEADFTARLDGDIPEKVSAPGLPKPAAGFAEGVRMGHWVFLSGDLASDWKGNWGAEAYDGGGLNGLAPEARTGGLFWGDEPCAKQTDYILSRLSKVAEAAGTSLALAVKAYVYLADPSDYAAFEDTWAKWFPDTSAAPARILVPNVEIGARGCRVEIGLDLLMPAAAHLKKPVAGGWSPKSKEPAAVRADDLIFFSGLMATDPGAGLAAEAAQPPGLPYFGTPGKLQMRYILQKAKRIAEAAGVDLRQVVKATLYFTDLRLYAGAMEAWAEAFADGHKPAVTAVEINRGLWVPGCGIMADLTLYDPQEA
ncbi:RidA family protein [Cohnella sp. JJ-181]|uniref:RidA family protein n=1 Tax=Cohnella rhizoplanae TaxID=2974897 RepID=UPI0022FFB028|nr:RidA family protein [Cohnella sp. JJ-181]CAI6025379.1 Putative aminoacrylate peracid reductase RutC [Cohnella sp. JJ-181]